MRKSSFHTVIVITLWVVVVFYKQQTNQVMALALPYLIHFYQWLSVDREVKLKRHNAVLN